mgnify:CR=1 FL=1
MGIQFRALHRGRFVKLVWSPGGLEEETAREAFFAREDVQTLMAAGWQAQQRHTDYVDAVTAPLADLDVDILSEPGRAIVGPAGVLLTRVEYLKHNEDKDFAIVDAAMNDLIRPSLYHAWQEIVAVDEEPEGTTGVYDVVGPICETGDFLGKDRELTVSPGSLLAVRSSGAYGFTMASNYNSRPMPAEVLVDGAEARASQLVIVNDLLTFCTKCCEFLYKTT